MASSISDFQNALRVRCVKKWHCWGIFWPLVRAGNSVLPWQRCIPKLSEIIVAGILQHLPSVRVLSDSYFPSYSIWEKRRRISQILWTAGQWRGVTWRSCRRKPIFDDVEPHEMQHGGVLRWVTFRYCEWQAGLSSWADRSNAYTFNNNVFDVFYDNRKTYLWFFKNTRVILQVLACGWESKSITAFSWNCWTGEGRQFDEVKYCR